MNGLPAALEEMWSYSWLSAVSSGTGQRRQDSQTPHDASIRIAKEEVSHRVSRVSDDYESGAAHSHRRTKPIMTLTEGLAFATSTTGFESATSMEMGFSSRTC